MASAAVCCEPGVIRDQFAALSDVQSVHVLVRDNTCRITVAVPTKDYSLEDKIYDAQYALMEHAPGLRIDLNIVVLGERKLEEIITCVGESIFTRAT